MENALDIVWEAVERLEILYRAIDRIDEFTLSSCHAYNMYNKWTNHLLLTWSFLAAAVLSKGHCGVYYSL